MALPFLSLAGTGVYASIAWPGLSITSEANHPQPHIRISLPQSADALSSAVYGGGNLRLQHIVNRYVDRHYDCSDPVADLQRFVRGCGYPEDATAGLLTAVRLTYASVREASGPQASAVCCVTAGTGNAARAGMSRTTYAAYRPGTINIVLAIDGNMTPACMVNALLTATEAKAAALGDLGAKDHETGAPATGTTTDAVVLCVSGNEAYGVEHRYAGTATDLGGMIGRLVYECVTESVTAERQERQ